MVDGALAEPGWYPDPEGGTRLRWWDGDDWSQSFRGRGATATRPSDVGVDDIAHAGAGAGASRVARGSVGRGRDAELDRIAEVVRTTTQEEMRRATASIEDTARGGVDRVVGEVRGATRDIGPLFYESVNRFTVWIKRALLLALVLGILWFILQVALNIGTAELIGDVVDGISDAVDDQDE